MRLFIAIKLSPEIKDTLTATQKYMRKQGVRGNYAPEENLHITLAFIGEYPNPDVVSEALEGVIFEPFDISLDEYGFFGDLFWAGLEGSEELSSLAKKVRRALAEAHVPFDKKAFKPHITLIRRAKYEKLPELKTKKTSMRVEHISLMRSDFVKNGVRYTEI